MADTNVAQDQIKAYVDRILRMKEEADAIAADVREIYNEAKANGFDKTQLGNLVTYLRKKDKDADKVAEGEAIFDLYLEAYNSAKGQIGTKRATHAYASEKRDPLAALRSNADLAIVEAADITPKTKTQPAPSQAASDLTTPHAPQGEVAHIQPETTEQSTESSQERAQTATGLGAGGDNLDLSSRHTATAETDVPTHQSQASGGVQSQDSSDVRVVSVDAGSSNGRTADFDSANAGSTPAPATSLYAAPGVVVWESCPPEGVERHPYSQAFGTLGQDIVVIGDDIAGAKTAPIVKIGKSILDGWARFMVARGAVGLDGQPTEYQVVQYDGTDPLLDCIRWNMAGRIMTDREKQQVVQRLSVIEPRRKAEIIKAVAEMAI